MSTVVPPTHTDEAEATPDDEAPAAPGRFLTGPKIAVLVVAVAFLAAVVGWRVGGRDDDPFSATDVGFMQDMGFHHEQAVQMSLLLNGKEDVPPELRGFANEIIVDQRFEQGVFNGILDRYGYSASAGEEVMGWMGEPVARDDMPGLATDAQMEELKKATGRDAEALWIALMTEHHLAGLHMADYAARHGQDPTVRRMAKAMVVNQRSEVIDLDRYRRRNDLPIPDGFGDPLKDQRLNPLAFTEAQSAD